MRRQLLGIAAMAALTATAAATADAHFRLEAPPAATMQDGQGSPQKTAPCGPNGAGAPTGAVTTYQAGSTITITIDETIFHPGHYRVALAVNDPSELPAAPPVTPSPSDECASTVIQDPPVFPVLADGELAHSNKFAGPQSFEVTLPSDVICDNCTLQVLEYMSSHGAPCFYYHCATIAIQEDPVMTTASSSGVTGGGSSGATSGAGGAPGSGGSTTSGSSFEPFPESDEGCSCAVVGQRGASGALALLGLAAGLAALARRRRH
jgi:MYXO-CTERM domain-containing protein